MKKYLLLSSFLFLSLFVKAQINLVPNFSFEQYDTCPNSADQVQYATGWSKYSNSISTPDYYNACASSGGVGVPQSFFLYQQAHRNCDAYVGLVTRTNNPNDREDAGVQLTQPLVIGQKYFLSFYTVMGGTSDGTFYYESPSNNIGMRLSTVAYSSSNPAPIDNFAHLRSVSIISDTLNWVRISGSIVADSAYNFLMLGNFYDDANTDTITLNCASCINNYSYCLIDDVCISTDSLLANGGIDALSCTTSVNELATDDKISIFPNPVTDMITISIQSSGIDEVVLTDMYGKICYAEDTSNKSSIMLVLTPYSSGVYFLKIINRKEKKSVSKKIIKL